MLKVYKKKLANFFLFLVDQILFLFLPSPQNETGKKTLLVLRLDSIGDYVLFRNYLEFIKRSKKYDGYAITLCGNILWKDLAEKYDAHIVDEFIWLERAKFLSNIFYRFDFLKRIRLKQFSVVIDPTYSREILFGDTLAKASSAPEKIGCTGSLDSHAKWKRKLLTDKVYNKLYASVERNLFEFNRNKEFFEHLLDEKIEIQKPFFISSSKTEFELPSFRCAVVFPGASDPKRIWTPKSFAVVSKFITEHLGLRVILSGSQNELSLSTQVKQLSASEKVEDWCGKVKLEDLPELVSRASFVVANETSAIHFAAAAGIPFFCISNGNHLGRFNPYPSEIFDNAFFIYPEEVEKNFTEIVRDEKFRFTSELDINTITPDRVIALIEKQKNTLRL